MRSVESTYKREHLAEKRGREHLALTTQKYIRIYTRKHLAEKNEARASRARKTMREHLAIMEARKRAIWSRIFEMVFFLGFAFS